MRRVVLECVINADMPDNHVVETVRAALDGHLVGRGMGQRPVYVLQLRPGDVVDFSDAEWKRLKELPK
jgi:hypothetical protein